MKKRIFLNMFALGLFIVFSLSLFLSLVFYNFFNYESKLYLQEEAELLAEVLNLQENREVFLTQLKNTSDSRITVINSKGKVIYDNYKDAGALEDHSARPEFNQAIQNGYGEYRRFSATLGEETYYYALRLTGNDVVRIAKTTQSIMMIFKGLLPWIVSAILVSAVLAFWLAGRLTKKIMLPLNNLRFDVQNNEIYEEIYPLVSKISVQKKQIDAQIGELEKRANTIDTIIKDMQEGFILLNQTGEILAINSTVFDFWDVSQRDFIGKNILELIRDPSVMEKVGAALAGKRQHILLEMGGKCLDMFCNPVFEKNEVIGANILFLDVTDKTAVEQLRKEFSANVSHELKTPLTTILGYSEMLENGMVKEADVQKFSGKIKAQIIHLKNLIDNIMKISELDEQFGEKNFEKFDIAELAKNVVVNFSDAAESANISVNIMPGQILIAANKLLVMELFTNLLDNAIKYNKSGGSVVINFTEIGDKLRVVVEDTGIGIAKDQLARVFERFYRVDPSRSKKTGGTGLGLSIVKHIAQYHGGHVQIDSVFNEGTSVTVWLDKNLS